MPEHPEQPGGGQEQVNRRNGRQGKNKAVDQVAAAGQQAENGRPRWRQQHKRKQQSGQGNQQQTDQRARAGDGRQRVIARQDGLPGGQQIGLCAAEVAAA
jgi:hypothetical protein